MDNRKRDKLMSKMAKAIAKLLNNYIIGIRTHGKD
jgi:hypothetical protein